MKKTLFIAAASAAIGIAGVASAEPAPPHTAGHGHDTNPAPDQDRACPHRMAGEGGTGPGMGAMPGMIGKDGSGMMADGHHMMGQSDHVMGAGMKDCPHRTKNSGSGSATPAPAVGKQ